MMETFAKRYDNSTFYTNAKELSAKGLNRFKGWECHSPKQHFFILYDGSVRATHCDIAPRLGWAWEGLTKYENTIVCTLDECSCLADVKTTKRAVDFNENPELIGLVQVEKPFDHYISWQSTTHCNFACEYCHPNSHTKTDEYVEIRQKVFPAIYDFAKGKKIFLEFLGGEPTLIDDLPIWVKKIKDLNVDNEIMITTNGSRSLKFLQSLLDYSYLSISVHLHQPKIHKLIDKIVQISKTHNINVELMCETGKISDAIHVSKKILEKANLNNLSISMNKLYPYGTADLNFNFVYTQKEIDIINKFNTKFIK